MEVIICKFAILGYCLLGNHEKIYAEADYRFVDELVDAGYMYREDTPGTEVTHYLYTEEGYQAYRKASAKFVNPRRIIW